MKVLEIKQIGNDIFAGTRCSCPDPKYKDNPALKDIVKTKIVLSGYSDSYFFNTVNEKLRKGKCPNCGREYEYQWKPNGVDFKFLPKVKTIGE